MRAPHEEQVWVSSINDAGLVAVPGTVVEQGSGSVTLASATGTPLVRGAEALLTFVDRENEQRLGRILVVEGGTLRIAIAQRTVQI